MQLTYFSDYALRLVLYLAAHPDRVVSVQEVSRAYRVSPHHMVKVARLLVGRGIVASVRGRRGGLRLDVAADQLTIGALVRLTEPNFNLVECFDRAGNTCPISPACGMKGVFERARGAFLDVLDEHTIAEFLPRAPALLKLWKQTA
jgi:Rrf2 family transcriptional regulator, nitric oxide-sensitive transcriptional repressor